MRILRFRGCGLISVLAVFVCIAAVITPAESFAKKTKAPQLVGFVPPQNPFDPIVVGSKKEVGKESVTSKTGKKIFGAVLGSVLGGSSGGGRSSEPKTKKDPSRKVDYVSYINKAAGDEFSARAKWDKKKGLLISNKIADENNKGTFQSVFLEDCDGRRLYPTRIEAYKLWVETTLTVSWTKTTYVDGQMVSQESGGWSESWITDLGTFGNQEEAGAKRIPAIWQQFGYNRAHAGVRQVGTYFNLSPAQMNEMGPLRLFTHVTRPTQDPVITQPVSWLLTANGNDLNLSPPITSAPVAGQSWQQSEAKCPKKVVQTAPVSTVVATGPGSTSGSTTGTTPVKEDIIETEPPIIRSQAKKPCEEGLLDVAASKSAYVAKLEDPIAALEAALAAADALGKARAAEAKANAETDADQKSLDALEQYKKDWDAWLDAKIERLKQHRQKTYGSSEPSWAKGSEARARKRHDKKSADLQQKIADQQAKLAQAKTAAAKAAAAATAAQQAFDDAMAAFAKALAGLKGAKDSFAASVVMYFRCSPCKVIADHWSSLHRLKDLLARLKAMLETASAEVKAKQADAQKEADKAKDAAKDAADALKELADKRSDIEQKMRDAVRADNKCISLEPKEGWGSINLAAMDGVRSTIVPEGSAQVYRSNYKGSDVKVYVKADCHKERIHKINWNKINKLNTELTDLQAEEDSARETAREAELTANQAAAKVSGLQAQQDAIGQLLKALLNSGLEANTDAVLKELNELSADCAQAFKEATTRTTEARRRAHAAQSKLAAEEARRDALRRKAEAEKTKLKSAKKIQDEKHVGDKKDKSNQQELEGQAGRLADGSRDYKGPRNTGHLPTAPATVEEAEKQRRKAEDDARRAEDKARRLKEDNDRLSRYLDELGADVGKHVARINAWLNYVNRLSKYHQCLAAKQIALARLAELNKDNASALKQLANSIGETSQGIKSAAESTSDFEKDSKRLKDANKKAKDLAKKLEKVGKYMENLDAYLRADDLKPSEKLKAMSDSLKLLRDELPDVPGVSEMLQFYNEAMEAIAGKIGEIEDHLTSKWVDLILNESADVDMAPFGIRNEVKKIVEIRRLMKIITHNCGSPPEPPK